MKKLLLLLALIPFTSGYVIKESKSNTNFDIYVSPGGTPVKAFSIDGTLGGVVSGQLANVRASEGAGTTTLATTDSRHQIFNLSAARTVSLPATAVIGEEWIIENRGAFDLTIQASGGQALTLANTANGIDASIQKGKVILTAISATPTTGAGWFVQSVHEIYVYSSTFTWNGSGSTSGSISITLNRVNNIVTSYSPQVTANTGTSSTAFTSNTAFASRFRITAAATDVLYAIPQEENNGATAFSGQVRVGSGGTFQFQKIAGATYTNSASAGTQRPWSLTWAIQ